MSVSIVVELNMTPYVQSFGWADIYKLLAFRCPYRGWQFRPHPFNLEHGVDVMLQAFFVPGWKTYPADNYRPKRTYRVLYGVRISAKIKSLKWSKR